MSRSILPKQYFMECHVSPGFCCGWLSSIFLVPQSSSNGWLMVIVGGYKVEDSVHSPGHGL